MVQLSIETFFHADGIRSYFGRPPPTKPAIHFSEQRLIITNYDKSCQLSLSLQHPAEFLNHIYIGNQGTACICVNYELTYACFTRQRT